MILIEQVKIKEVIGSNSLNFLSINVLREISSTPKTANLVFKNILDIIVPDQLIFIRKKKKKHPF